MNIPDIFIDYMKALAINHPLIRHKDEQGKVAFVVDDLMDLLDGVFKTALKNEGFSMRCGEPIIRPLTDAANGMLANIDAGFSILKKVSFSSNSIYEARKECYSIVKNLIARMVLDSRNDHELFSFSLNLLEYGRFTIEPVVFEGDGTWAGQIVTFSFKSDFIEDIETEFSSTNWLDT